MKLILATDDGEVCCYWQLKIHRTDATTDGIESAVAAKLGLAVCDHCAALFPIGTVHVLDNEDCVCDECAADFHKKP